MDGSTVQLGAFIRSPESVVEVDGEKLMQRKSMREP
jgi:hypothetical protein